MKEYNRLKAIQYAKKWAYSRNPAYYNFDPVGGDCTSFVSQCLYAGGKIMNYQKDTGWYYRSGNDKSPSWTGVEFLYKFLIENKGRGPYGIKASEIEVSNIETNKIEINNIQTVEIGDIAQISFDGKNFSHSLLIVDINGKKLNNISVSTHTFDSYERKLNTYLIKKVRFIHIIGFRE